MFAIELLVVYSQTSEPVFDTGYLSWVTRHAARAAQTGQLLLNTVALCFRKFLGAVSLNGCTIGSSRTNTWVLLLYILCMPLLVLLHAAKYGGFHRPAGLANTNLHPNSSVPVTYDRGFSHIFPPAADMPKPQIVH